MLDGFLNKFHDKKVADFSLNISRSKETGIFLNIVDTVTGKVLKIKQFKNNADYNRFLVEAVILRSSVHNRDIKQVREVYRKLCSFMKKHRSDDSLTL